MAAGGKAPTAAKPWVASRHAHLGPPEGCHFGGTAGPMGVICGYGRAEGCPLGGQRPTPSPRLSPLPHSGGAAARPERAAISIQPRRHAALPAALRRPCLHAASAAVPPAAGGAAGEAGGRCGVLAAPQPGRFLREPPSLPHSPRRRRG